MHIGELIKKRVKELKMSNSEFADKINCHRTNIYNIYSQPTIDIVKLQKISEVLNYDFFAHYTISNPNDEGRMSSKLIEITRDEVCRMIEGNDRIIIEITVKN